MIPARELAHTLSGSIFDHVEQERVFLRHRIEDVICDGLMLHGAKSGTPSTRGAAKQELDDAVTSLMALLLNDASHFNGMSRALRDRIDAIYLAYGKTLVSP